MSESIIENKWFSCAFDESRSVVKILYGVTEVYDGVSTVKSFNELIVPALEKIPMQNTYKKLTEEGYKFKPDKENPFRVDPFTDADRLDALTLLPLDVLSNASNIATYTAILSPRIYDTTFRDVIGTDILVYHDPSDIRVALDSLIDAYMWIGFIFGDMNIITNYDFKDLLLISPDGDIWFTLKSTVEYLSSKIQNGILSQDKIEYLPENYNV